MNENERLQERMNHLFDRIEASLRQSFRLAVTDRSLPDNFDAAARANLVVAYVIGRWQRFAKTGFRKSAVELLDAQLPALLV